MLGRSIGDLETGDVFEPVQYIVTSLMTSEYAHGVEETSEWFYSSDSPWERQARVPTMIHSDKMRILEANCPQEPRVAGFRGPDARIHYEYHARHHNIAFVGDELTVSGRIADRYVKRGRVYLHYNLEVHTADGRLVTEYWDRTVLKYRQEESQ
jgi:N-terminal half of MaoC dehydratase